MLFYSRKIEKLAMWSNAGIIAGVLLPWLSFEIIAPVSISGFSLSLGKILVGLSLVNFFIAASVKRRTQALVDVVVAGIDLYLLYSTYQAIKAQALGQFFLQVLPWQFGLYLTIVSCLVLLGTGVYRLAGDSTWWAYTLKNRFRFLTNETAASTEIQPSLLWGKLAKRKPILILVPLLLVYFISIPLYNSTQSPRKTTENFMAAVQHNNANALRSMMVSTNQQPLTSVAAQAYILYYQKHLDELQNILESLNGNPVLYDSNISLDKKSTLGYISYKVRVNTAHLMGSAPKGSLFTVNQNKQTTNATGNPQDLGVFVTGVPLNITATDKTPWGDVVETKQFVPGSGTSTFAFSKDKLTISSSGLVTGAEINIDGKDSGQKVGQGDVVLGPLPQGKVYSVSTLVKEPFGDIAFAASSEINPSSYYNNGLKLIADQESNKPVLESIAHFLFQRGTQGAVTNQKLTVYAKTLQMIQDGNGIGIQIQTSENDIRHDFSGDHPETNWWIYTLGWDKSSSTWKIGNAEQPFYWFSPSFAGKNDVTVNG